MSTDQFQSHDYYLMDELLSDEHKLIRETARAWVKKEVSPIIEEYYEKSGFPHQILKGLAEIGGFGPYIPVEYGGAGLDQIAYGIIMQELERCDSGLRSTSSVQSSLVMYPIYKFGNEEQRKKYLPKLASGDMIGCFGLTEPDFGSNPGGMITNFVDKGDHYLLNGSKTYITNGVYGDFVITVCKTNPSAGTKGISLIVIDLNSDGINRTKIDKLGWHASDTAEISFDNVKVPKENLIGEEGKGFYYLMNGLQLERLIFVPSCIGAMELAISESIKYMKERKSFGQTIDKFQVLRHKIATLSSQIESVKVFGYYCCNLYNKKIYDVKLCSMAKLLVTELHEKVATECLQFFGGNGFSEEYPLARMYRDCRVGTIGAGTSEIMREIIAKVILEETKYEETKS